jgi:hypothetical protein
MLADLIALANNPDLVVGDQAMEYYIGNISDGIKKAAVVSSLGLRPWEEALPPTASRLCPPTHVMNTFLEDSPAPPAFELGTLLPEPERRCGRGSHVCGNLHLGPQSEPLAAPSPHKTASPHEPTARIHQPRQLANTSVPCVGAFLSNPLQTLPQHRAVLHQQMDRSRMHLELSTITRGA